MENIKKNDFFDRVLEVLKNARRQAKLALNISMVYSYYEVGRIIFEEEQNGEKRAEYGKAILKELSKRLTESLGKGFSVENLRLSKNPCYAAAQQRFFFKAAILIATKNCR